MTRRIWLSTSLIVAGLAFSPLQAASSKEFPKTYFVDVEGGQATLFVTPTGQSLLVDTGLPGLEGRDADRIVAATRSSSPIRRVAMSALSSVNCTAGC